MNKQELQKIVNEILGTRGPKAQVSGISDGIVKISVVGKCGGSCGCSHKAFDDIRAEILNNYKEIKEVVKIDA